MVISYIVRHSLTWRKTFTYNVRHLLTKSDTIVLHLLTRS